VIKHQDAIVDGVVDAMIEELVQELRRLPKKGPPVRQTPQFVVPAIATARKHRCLHRNGCSHSMALRTTLTTCTGHHYVKCANNHFVHNQYPIITTNFQSSTCCTPSLSIRSAVWLSHAVVFDPFSRLA
jgi:hypothetical protein